MYLNVVDRHIEQSEVWEATLNVRAVQKPEGIEEVVLKKIQAETLHMAMKKTAGNAASQDADVLF